MSIVKKKRTIYQSVKKEIKNFFRKTYWSNYTKINYLYKSYFSNNLNEDNLISILTITRYRPEKFENLLNSIIKNTVNYSILNTKNDDKHLEVQGIKVTQGETNNNRINTYIPPSSSCDSNYTASISNLLKLEDSIIVGDFTLAFEITSRHQRQHYC